MSRQLLGETNLFEMLYPRLTINPRISNYANEHNAERTDIVFETCIKTSLKFNTRLNVVKKNVESYKLKVLFQQTGTHFYEKLKTRLNSSDLFPNNYFH